MTIYQQRDQEIKTIKARKGHRCYGMGIGIMILDDVYPGFPGDVRNASAYPFPIQYEIVKGINIHSLLVEEDKGPCLEPLKQAATNLMAMGCRAIAAECGYFSYFQKELSCFSNIPVFMSSLLQVPWAQILIGPKRKVGILLGGRAESLSDKHLESVGVSLGSNYLVLDKFELIEESIFQSLWSPFGKRSDPPGIDYDEAQKEILSVCIEFQKRHPDMGAIVLECTGYQPFARAIQMATDLPVFSWGTLLDYAYSVVVHRDYYGHV
jgi:hypothetical protein